MFFTFRKYIRAFVLNIRLAFGLYFFRLFCLFDSLFWISFPFCLSLCPRLSLFFAYQCGKSKRAIVPANRVYWWWCWWCYWWSSCVQFSHLFSLCNCCFWCCRGVFASHIHIQSRNVWSVCCISVCPTVVCFILLLIFTLGWLLLFLLLLSVVLGQWIIWFLAKYGYCCWFND